MSDPPGSAAISDGITTCCPVCGASHNPSAGCARLWQVAESINLFAVPAFLTDPLNRFVWVNNVFSRLVGDPIRDRVAYNFRFIPAAVVGPYRDRFPRGRQEVAQCIQGISQEVLAGRLAAGVVSLTKQTLELDADLRRAARKTDSEWDGTLVIRADRGETTMVREQVVPVANIKGEASGFNISVWGPVDRDIPTLAQEVEDRPRLSSILTPRQLEMARYYGFGLTSKEVASKTGVTPGTARAHLEEIYSRLDLHSRVALAALLIREGIV